MAQITPTFLFDFQRNLNLKYANAWARVLNKLWYQRITLVQPSSSLEELYEWMLETAQIVSTNSKGSELTFEDLVAVSWRIKNENFGNALRLNRNEFEDNKYDRAAKWAADTGNAGAYWPQRQAVTLIQNGKTKLCFDGKAFFATDHPVNPYDDSAGTYSNLFTSKPLNAANLATVVAEIMKIKGPNDAPRYLEPSVLMVDPSNQLTANVLLGAEIFTDPTNVSGGAPATNIIKSGYGLGMPLVVPEFASEPGVWYLGVQANQDAFEGAIIYQERKPFELTSYTGLTQVDLDRTNDFEWHNRGRNTAAYGLPYMLFRCEP